MKRSILLLSIIFTLLVSANAFALPTLLNEEVNSLDIKNYENIYRADGSGGYTLVLPGEEIQSGDVFAGIFKVSDISDVNQTNDVDLLGGEVTGYFQATVDSVTITNSGADRHVQFADSADSFIRVYFDDKVDGDSNLDWNPGAVSALKDIESLASATGANDGELWFASEGSAGFVDQYTKIVNAGLDNAAITGFNWYNITENNTNLDFASEIWPQFSGEYWPGVTGQSADGFFQYNISPQVATPGNQTAIDTAANWTFQSVDPGYLYGSQVPEPATIMLLGLGLLGCAGITRKKLS